MKGLGLTQLQGHWFKCSNGECRFAISVQVLLKINAFDTNFLWVNLDSIFFKIDSFVFDVSVLQELVRQTRESDIIITLSDLKYFPLRFMPKHKCACRT